MNQTTHALVRALFLSAFLLTTGLTIQAQCTLEEACNYDPDPMAIEDNSCFFIGSPCDDSNATTFNDKYTDCNTCSGTLQVLGCMDSAACNYNSTANVSANCKYQNDVCDDGFVQTIADKLDGACNCAGVAAVVGCMDSGACNYDNSANIPGPCLNAFIVAGDPTGQVWTCSQAIADGEGDLPGSGVNYTKTWNADHGNGLGVLVDNDMNNNGFLDELEVYGCMEPGACNYKDPSVYGTTHTKAFSDSPNPCETVQYACEYCGQLNDDGEPIRYSNGNLNANQDEATGSEILVVDFENDGTPSATQGGLTAVAKHPLYRVIDGDSNNEGPCDGNDTYGCRAITACNYDPNASLQAEDTYDDATGTWIPACKMPGSCGCKTPGGVQFYPPVSQGGTAAAEADKDATVFDMPAAACDCSGNLVDSVGDCGGTCTADNNSNGICDAQEVNGCMDSGACNYNTAANVDDSSCLSPGTCGCSGETDGTGIAVNMPGTDCGCGGEQLDQLGQCLLPSDGAFCSADSNGNNLCDANEVVGCTNPSACNYVAANNATYDDGSCQYLDECGVCGGSGIPALDCDCDGNVLDACQVCGGVCTVDLNANGLDDTTEVRGCTDPTSCTYNPNATFDPSTHGVFEDVCKVEDVCGECDGLGITDPSHCDCFGNTIDAMGVCGGTCSGDVDEDGICDDVDPCIGAVGEDLRADFCGRCYVCLHEDTDGNCIEFAAGGVTEADYGNEVETGFDCGCYNQPAQACDCTEDTDGIYIVNYPEPGKDCDGICLWGTDPNNPSVCLIYEGAVATVLSTPTKTFTTSNKSFRSVDTFDNEEWMANVDTLHKWAGYNLDDITTSGGSDSLTIEHRIRDKGELIVEGMTYLQDSMTVGKGAFVTGDVEVGGNLLVNGYARIVGTTFSDGGLETTTIAMSGGLDVGGTITGADSLIINGFTALHDTLRVDDEISVGLRKQVVMDSTGLLTFDQGLVREDLQVRDSLIANSLDLGGNFKVNTNKFVVNASTGNTTTKGTLGVDGATTLRSTLVVSNNLRVENSSITRFGVDAANGNTAVGGTFSVTGNTTLSGNSDVTGNLTVAGSSSLVDASLSSTLGVTGLTTLSGGLTLLGASATTLGGALTVTKATTLSSTLGVTGLTTLSGGLTLLGTSATTLGGALTVAGNLTHNGTGTFHSKASNFLVGSTASAVPGATNYAMVVDGKGNSNANGIVIRSSAAESTNAVNFVTFMNSGGTVVGRIEGETKAQKWNDADFSNEHRQAAVEVADATLEVVAAGWDVFQAFKDGAKEVTGAVASAVPGAGLTDCDVAESIKKGISAAVEFGTAHSTIFGLIQSVGVLIASSANLAVLKSTKDNEIGVTYQSSAGDYAEWIEKQDVRMDFAPGEIIGVKGGLLSYDTDYSDHNLVISTKPIVLGKAPGDESHFEMVAFMGQVPIRIQGPVEVGDFIIPSGEHNGFGLAISSDDIRMDQIAQIVGIAWERGADKYFNVVNCSVGLDNGGTSKLVELVGEEMDLIREEMSREIQLQLGGVEHQYAEAAPARGGFFSRIFRPSAQSNTVTTTAMVYENDGTTDEEPVTTAYSVDDDGGLSAHEVSLIEDIVDDVLYEWNEEAMVIGKEEIAQGWVDLEGALSTVHHQIEGVLSSGGDFSKNIFNAFDYGSIPQEVLKIDAAITLSIFDHYMEPAKLRPMLRETLAKVSSGEHGLDLLSVYPPGSAAETQLIDQTIRDVENIMYQASPHLKLYGYGR